MDTQEQSNSDYQINSLEIVDAAVFCLYIGTGRQFLKTDGRCGCGPRGLEPGDLICVFSGLQFPFIVRPQGSEYILVGAAIFDGVMDGEAWPEDESQLTEWKFV